MTVTDPTAAGLLRAILADPADDLPRLAYADWLEVRQPPLLGGYQLGPDLLPEPLREQVGDRLAEQVREVRQVPRVLLVQAAVRVARLPLLGWHFGTHSRGTTPRPAEIRAV